MKNYLIWLSPSTADLSLLSFSALAAFRIAAAIAQREIDELYGNKKCV